MSELGYSEKLSYIEGALQEAATALVAAQSELDAKDKEIKYLREALTFVERWAVAKTGPADERLSVIAHFPPISAITKSFPKASQD